MGNYYSNGILLVMMLMKIDLKLTVITVLQNSQSWVL